MLKKSWFVVVAVSLVLLFTPAVLLAAKARAKSLTIRKGTLMSMRQTGRVRAPELTGGRGWLNTDKPLSLAALRGKVVLLDFWTYGCINCIHIIPDLQRLEEKYAKQLVVIGVHSAKFDNEKETDNIRRIIVRYGIEHPVVNDADFAIWQSYAVRAWPTQVLIDPSGYVVGVVQGEGNYDVIDRAVGQLVGESRARGELNEQPLKLALERAKVGDLPLAFPGKVLADERGRRLFIADSNHNRIVVAKLDGTLIETIGTGERGMTSGAFDAATFNRPQGMTLDGDSLYVADTGNHALRRVDLTKRVVETVAGTGLQGRWNDETTTPKPAATTGLSSPWDLYLGTGRTIYIAMAGPHQIWSYDIARREVRPFAGSGREARIDGALLEAGFAQPSGLASDGKSLFVADSESNIIRAIDIAGNNPQVRTLAGGDLFEFGDREGRGDSVRLQHPLGVLYTDGALLVADTYNHRIKRLDPETRTVKNFAGTGKPGQSDGTTASFYEPGGLSAADGKLYVADTNNHAVRVVDLKTGQTSTLMLRGLQPPATNTASTTTLTDADNTTAPNTEETRLAPQRLRANATATLNVDVALPDGYHLNPSAPQRYRVSIDHGDAHVALGTDTSTASVTNATTSTTTTASTNTPASKITTRTTKDLKLPLRLPLRALAPGAAEMRVQLTLYYCREDNTGTCQIKTLLWRAPLQITADALASNEIKIQGQIK
ncbi:MAG TPA: thioredoxin-like domain-containing protein [Pyrinomonadaceae bacterium]|jgi:thiol-disulfide isomerase/thioredoxin